MFSCLLVRASEKAESDASEDVLVAERVDLDVQMISNAGRGSAECRFVVDMDSESVVACIPSRIRLKDSSTQQVKVTSSVVEVLRDGDTSTSTALQLTKLDGDYTTEHAKSMPNYQAIKKLLKRSVSQDDLLLYLGNFEALTTIVLKFEFLLQLKASFSVSRHPTIQCMIENSIPARRFTYKLRFASNMQIVGVAASPPLPINFSWTHVDRTKQIVLVSYETNQPATATAAAAAGACNTSEFCIKMAQNFACPTLSACCSCLVGETTSDASRCTTFARPSSGGGGRREYDGVMMLSSRLTPDQLLPKGQGNASSKHLCPSEFVFLVDCSASMNPFINSVIATLITSIKSLPEGCYFNLISFGSSFRQLFPKSKEYSKASAKNAVDFANQMKASLGGTELLPPLKWIFKMARKSDMPCQVFIITDVDQEVKDVPYMLNTIKKHRDHARCHTFGIGSGICESLVTSIAEVSGGRSIILREGDRLQTKVMDVLKESLDPFLMEAKIKWNPPRGYSVVDSTPKALGTVYCHRTGLAFAFLKKSAGISHHAPASSTPPPATITGRLGGPGGVAVEVPIPEAVLPPLTPLQTTELASVLAQVGTWSKLDELEVTRLLAVSRKNSTEEAEIDEDPSLREPHSKRPRLNGEAGGTTSTAQNHTPSYPPPAEIQSNLLRLSLESGVSCPFTFFKGTLASSHEPTGSRDIVQALPYKQSSSLSQPSHQKGKNGMVSQRHHQDLRRRRHHHHHHRNGSSRAAAAAAGSQQGGSIASSLAKSTISAVSSALMNFVSLIHPEATAVREEGKTIEDELEMGKRKGTQLFWDERKGEIKYPSMYFKQNKSSGVVGLGGEVHNNHHHHRRHHGNKAKHSDHHYGVSRSSAVAATGSIHPLHLYGSVTNGHCAKAQAPPYCHTSSSSNGQQPMDTSSSSDDEEDFTISDSESDSSIDLDWESLPKTREYLPMIQMQLFNGAWPMVHEFSYAVRVPLGEIGRLPLLGSPSQKNLSEKTAVKIPRGNLTQELDEELSAHFWTTALAVTCFRECYPQFESEWELIVSKGEAWLEQNLDQCALGKEEVRSMAKELLFRKA